MSLEAIKAAIPHREPFLLLDEIVERSDQRIVCRKTFTGDEFWYPGHYPDNPLTPGVLLCEAAMQAGAVLLSGVIASEPDRIPVVTRIGGIRFKRMVRPGDTVDLEVDFVEQVSRAYILKGRVMVDSKVAVQLDFTCMMVAKDREE